MVPLEHLEPDEGHATFRPDGPTTAQAFLMLLEQAMKACQESGVTRLLVDTRKLSHGRFTTVERFELGTKLAASWDRHIRLVMVGRPDQIDRELFAALVAQNRGLHVGVHETEPEALGDQLAWTGRDTSKP